MEIKIIFEVIGLIILDVIVLGGNALVMLAFALGPKRIRTFTNYFIVNLAIADFLVGVLPIPFWIYVRLGAPELNSTTHLIFLGFDVSFGVASIFNLTLISMERMMAVRYPTKHFNISWKPVILAIVMTWVFSAIIAGLSVFFGLSRHYTYFLCVIVFLIPTFAIIYCYAEIFKVAKRSSATTNNQMKHELRTAKMISIIIGLFLICWLPFFIMNIIYTHCSDWCSSIPDEILLIAKFLHYANSMMNVCVYASCSPLFRKTFKAILKRKSPSASIGSTSGYRSTARRNLTTTEYCSDDDTTMTAAKRCSKSDPFMGNTPI